MDTRDNPKIERAIRTVAECGQRVLIQDNYYDSELRRLRDALAYLLDETWRK